MNKSRVAQELVSIAKDLSAMQQAFIVDIFITYDFTDRLRPAARKALGSIAKAFGGRVLKEFTPEDKGWSGWVEVFAEDVNLVKRKVSRHFKHQPPDIVVEIGRS